MPMPQLLANTQLIFCNKILHAVHIGKVNTDAHILVKRDLAPFGKGGPNTTI